MDEKDVNEGAVEQEAVAASEESTEEVATADAEASTEGSEDSAQGGNSAEEQKPVGDAPAME